MSEKTYVFGTEGANNSLLASLIPALQNKGVDTGYLLGMLNNGNNGGLFGGRGFEDIIALIIVAAIFGNGNFGFGNGGNNFGAANAEREMLMSAIQRNGVDISQLASTLNCSVGKLDTAIGQVATQICNLTGQVGMSSQQIINSVQFGNSQLANQIANCCCDLKSELASCCCDIQRDIATSTAATTRGFADVGYALRDQTCNLEKAIAASTQQILAGQAAIEKRELQREIATLQEEKQTYKLGNMIAAATNPIASELESIKCRLPKTEVIPATSEYVPVNRSINVAYAPYCGYGFGAGYGFGGWGSNGCGNSLWG
jgi:hypothetical protein